MQAKTFCPIAPHAALRGTTDDENLVSTFYTILTAGEEGR